MAVLEQQEAWYRQKIWTLVDEKKIADEYSVTWSIYNNRFLIPDGIYFCRMSGFLFSIFIGIFDVTKPQIP